MSPRKPRRRSVPHSTMEKFSQRFLPPAIHAFLFGKSEASLASYLVAGALFGALSGAVLFLCIAHNLPLTIDMKLVAGSLFTCVCVVLGALSSSFRCSALLMLPAMLGSSGRSYLMVLMMSVLYSGPVSNIQRNAEAAAMSVSCNLDLQVRHSRLVWREAIKPFILVTQELVEDKTGFQSETQSVDSKFHTIRDELVLQYGYDRFTSSSGGNSTQEQFASKTIMQCDSVVEKGVERCVDWFNGKLAECMEAIPVPVINHILCVFMRFNFLCDILRVMTPWCRENVPVEGNFGQLYDQLNTSIDLLSREFSAELLVEEEQQQEVLDGDLLDQEFTQAVAESFKKLTTTSQKILEVLQLLLCFTFITIFIRAFVYQRSYKNDILFDNLYITTYFRQIDARRNRVGKRFLLPLKSSERKIFIVPWSPKMYPEEFKQVTSGMFQVIFVLLLSLVLFAVDFVLFRVLDIIRRHTITQFNVISSHHVDIRVDGDSMMSHLLRSTISAFNSSSSFELHSDNLECVPHISPLPFGIYMSCMCSIVLVALFSFLQVYTNRLRRVISSFYYPKREKKRVLFLYNLQVRRRISSSNNQVVGQRQKTVTVFQRLARWGRDQLRRH